MAAFALAVGVVSALQAGFDRDRSGFAAPPGTSAPTPTTAPVTATAPAPARPGEPPTHPAARPSRDPVPILMYHEIGDPMGRLTSLYVRPSDFAAQMEFLARHGFHAITLSQALDAWEGKAAMPRNPIVISFDDGYASTYSDALPVLRKHGQHATLFLQAGIVGRPHALTADMVQAWIEAGNEIGSHTVTHPDLRKVDPVRLLAEVAGSRQQLERRFGVTVRTFAYPSGRFNDAVVRAVRDAGYEAAATTVEGLGRPDHLFTLRRIRVYRSEGLAGFVKNVEAYLGRRDVPHRPSALAAPR